jgi:unsaturated chondroitin disaccharide hydrolase
VRSRALSGGALLTDALVADAQARLLARIDGTAPEMRPAFPHAADSETGRWEAKAGGAWTDGFWVGLCWLAYRLTKADRYRDWGLEWAARLRGRERTVEYHMRRTPLDPVTFNDYDDPRIPQAPRDTSAAAILASSALALEEAGAGPAGRYRDEAGRIVAALVAGYLTPLGPDDRRPPGMLLHGCYNPCTGEAPDHELIWGDYFLLEALARWQGR